MSHYTIETISKLLHLIIGHSDGNTRTCVAMCHEPEHANLVHKALTELEAQGSSCGIPKSIMRNIASHDIYTDNDKDRPDVICDSNGQVVLGLCKVCGKAEVELDEPCTPAAIQQAGEMPVEQEPKYGIRDGKLFNRASGEFIPADEPVFIFRARDTHAVNVLAGYAREVVNADHAAAVWGRVDDFKRFWDANPDRMKQPDTASPASSVASALSAEQEADLFAAYCKKQFYHDPAPVRCYNCEPNICWQDGEVAKHWATWQAARRSVTK